MTGYGSTWTYTYDAFGERVRKYEGSYRYYLTSGMNILEEYNHSQNLNAVHIYNGTLRLATIIPGDDIYYVCSDQIMSSRVLVDDAGNCDQARDYYPYGATSFSTGSVSAYQFSGKEKDATGLYYFGKRYYDPYIGRWLSVDPMADKYPSLSPYVYCHNNPLNNLDPNGKWDIPANQRKFIEILQGYEDKTGIDCTKLIRLAMLDMEKANISSEFGRGVAGLLDAPKGLGNNAMNGATRMLTAAMYGMYDLEISTMDKIEPGDLLLTSKHVEVYIGEGKEPGTINLFGYSERKKKIIERPDLYLNSTRSPFESETPTVVKIHEKKPFDNAGHFLRINYYLFRNLNNDYSDSYTEYLNSFFIGDDDE